MSFADCSYRSFERYTEEIDPGPEPDAREIAGRVVEAMRRAYETEKPQNIMLHTIRLGANLWRQYAVRFDPEQNEVAVRVGPIVDTSQVPLPGSEPPPFIPPSGGERGGEKGTGQSRHTNGAHLRRGEPHRHLQRAVLQVRAPGR